LPRTVLLLAPLRGDAQALPSFFEKEHYLMEWVARILIAIGSAAAVGAIYFAFRSAIYGLWFHNELWGRVGRRLPAWQFFILYPWWHTQPTELLTRPEDWTADAMHFRERQIHYFWRTLPWGIVAGLSFFAAAVADALQP